MMAAPTLLPRRRDYLPAFELTANALALSEKAHGQKAGGELSKEALNHRLKRLKNKMLKTGHQIPESTDSRFCSGLTLPDKVITNSSSSAPELSSGRLSGLKSEPAADA